jgi:hypothetical protein
LPRGKDAPPLGLEPKIAVVAGADAGAENRAAVASQIETCKMKTVDPRACMASTFTAIISGHTQSRIEDLPPWICAAKV